MQSETGFPSSHQLKSYVASKSRLKLAARAVLSADAGLLVYFVRLDVRLLRLNKSLYFTLYGEVLMENCYFSCIRATDALLVFHQDLWCKNSF